MKTRKAGHTPGPWEVHESRLNKGSKYTILHPLINGPDADPEYIGKLGGYHVVIGESNCLDGYILDGADARLIAAAPELLAALEAILKDMPIHKRPSGAVAVLRKAKGE